MSEYYKVTPGFFENIPKKIAAAGVLFYNEAGGLLLLKPNYKPGWTIPGGILDAMESPLAGAIREVKEEIGLYKPDLRLLCVDYMQAENPQRDSLQFIFHGGVLTVDEIRDIKLQEDELEDMQFFFQLDAIENLSKNLKKRVQAAIQSQSERPVYLEAGLVPDYRGE